MQEPCSLAKPSQADDDGAPAVDDLSGFHPVGWFDECGLHYFADQDAELDEDLGYELRNDK